MNESNQNLESFSSIMSTQPTDTPLVIMVNAEDKAGIQNIRTTLNLYEKMINQKQSESATAEYLHPEYIQHNPMLPDGPIALGQVFAQFTSERKNLHVVVHKIMAVNEYVWAHVNFVNLTSDDPADTGIAGVDIYRFAANGKAIEHWDTLQVVGSKSNAVPWMAPNIPAANPNGMF